MKNRDQDHQPNQQPAHASSDAVVTDRDQRSTSSYTADCVEAALRCEEETIMARASEILFRHMERGAVLTDPRVAGQYCAMQLRGYDREVFGVLFLDNRHRAIAFENLFFGTLDGAEVHPREVARAALRHNAAAIIICHNHPSGSPEPSAADRAVTLRLRDALGLLDIRMLDHFIIGDGEPTSLAARGWV